MAHLGGRPSVLLSAEHGLHAEYYASYAEHHRADYNRPAKKHTRRRIVGLAEGGDGDAEATNQHRGDDAEKCDEGFHFGALQGMQSPLHYRVPQGVPRCNGVPPGPVVNEGLAR